MQSTNIFVGIFLHSVNKVGIDKAFQAIVEVIASDGTVDDLDAVNIAKEELINETR